MGDTSVLQKRGTDSQELHGRGKGAPVVQFSDQPFSSSPCSITLPCLSPHPIQVALYMSPCYTFGFGSFPAHFFFLWWLHFFPELTPAEPKLLS